MAPRQIKNTERDPHMSKRLRNNRKKKKYNLKRNGRWIPPYKPHPGGYASSIPFANLYHALSLSLICKISIEAYSKPLILIKPNEHTVILSLISFSGNL